MVKTFLDGLLLPINPFDDITITMSGKNKQIEIVGIGDVTILGNRGLYGITIKSLFTDNIYPWSVTADPKPADYYVDYIKKLIDRKKPVRLVITGDGLDVNMLCSIEGFTEVKESGETNESYYTIPLKEYPIYKITRIETIPGELKRTVTQVVHVKSSVESKGRTYTVKKGDCLYGIAQSCYQDGSQYPKIYAANKSMMDAYNNKHGIPKYTIYSGWVLTIP